MRGWIADPRRRVGNDTGPISFLRRPIYFVSSPPRPLPAAVLRIWFRSSLPPSRPGSFIISTRLFITRYLFNSSCTRDDQSLSLLPPPPSPPLPCTWGKGEMKTLKRFNRGPRGAPYTGDDFSSSRKIRFTFVYLYLRRLSGQVRRECYINVCIIIKYRRAIIYGEYMNAKN